MAVLLCGRVQVLSRCCGSMHQPLILAFFQKSFSYTHILCYGDTGSAGVAGFREWVFLKPPSAATLKQLPGGPEPQFLGTELCCVALGSSQSFT